jgi:hypothetical protein
VAQANAPLIALRATNYGNGETGGQVFPAFGLSGDYIVQGEFTLDGTTYSCSQKVQVRAPGIRAELCWDTVGGSNSTQGNDIDLHFARLQGVTCTTRGWNTLCANSGGGVQDCYWAGASGCTNNNANPQWGYANSATSACQGWSSRRTAACTNPRLDRDNVSCDRGMADPTNTAFCGPENINIDAPNNVALWIQRGKQARSYVYLTRRNHLPRSRQKRMITRNINPSHRQEDAVNLFGKRKAVTDNTMDPCPARLGPTPAPF